MAEVVQKLTDGKLDTYNFNPLTIYTSNNGGMVYDKAEMFFTQMN